MSVTCHSNEHGALWQFALAARARHAENVLRQRDGHLPHEKEIVIGWRWKTWRQPTAATLFSVSVWGCHKWQALDAAPTVDFMRLSMFSCRLMSQC